MPEHGDCRHGIDTRYLCPYCSPGEAYKEAPEEEMEAVFMEEGVYLIEAPEQGAWLVETDSDSMAIVLPKELVKNFLSHDGSVERNAETELKFRLRVAMERLG